MPSLSYPLVNENSVASHKHIILIFYLSFLSPSPVPVSIWSLFQNYMFMSPLGRKEGLEMLLLHINQLTFRTWLFARGSFCSLYTSPVVQDMELLSSPECYLGITWHLVRAISTTSHSHTKSKSVFLDTQVILMCLEFDIDCSRILLSVGISLLHSLGYVAGLAKAPTGA